MRVVPLGGLLQPLGPAPAADQRSAPPPSPPPPPRRIKAGSYSEVVAARLVREILRTVAQCHAENVMIRDVKPENVREEGGLRLGRVAACMRPCMYVCVWRCDGIGTRSTLAVPALALELPGSWALRALNRARPPSPAPAARAQFLFAGPEEGAPLKAIDFGISVFCAPGQVVDLRAGTPIFIAPEVLRNRYSLEADLWSVGIVAYQLLTGRLPFAGEEGLEVSELYMTKQVGFREGAEGWGGGAGAA